MPGIDECLLEAMLVPGARGASIVDSVSGLALGTVGEASGEDHEATAAETAELARVAAEYAAFASPGGSAEPLDDGLAEPRDDGPAVGGRSRDAPPVEDLIVTTGTCYHLVRFVDAAFNSTVSTVFLHLWLDRDLGNLALARLRMRSLAERLVLG
ncbi:hypothetical protein ACWF94_29255 [Streptomyces sp. NPDC055078]